MSISQHHQVRAFTAIEAFLGRALQPPYTEISSMAELTALQSEYPIIFVYFQTDSQSVVDPSTKVRNLNVVLVLISFFVCEKVL